MSVTLPGTTTLPEAPTRRPGRALVTVLATAGIVVATQQTLVIPLVPQLPALLGVSAADASWAVTATLLAGAVATPTVGRLADMFGKRRMLMLCLAMVTIGSTVAALSTGLGGLIVGRALQGLGVGVIPLGISLMRDHLPLSRLPGATASMSASLGVGGAFGLPLAALIIEHVSWHAVFWVSAGLAVIVAGLVLRFVPESPAPGGRFDLVGAVVLAAALLALLLGLTKAGSWGWTDPLTLGLFGTAAVLLPAWAVWELRSAHPLVDLRISRRRQVLLTNSASLVFGFGMLTSSLVFPQLVQLPAASGYGFGRSILVAGLVQAPGGLAMMAMSPVSARLTGRFGARVTLMAGAATVALGYAFGATLHSEIWHVLVAVLVVTSGIGLAYGAIPSLIMAAVPLGQTAAANSFNNLSRAIGTSTASAAVGVILAQLTMTTGGHTYPAESAFTIALALGALGAAGALAIAFFLPRHRAAGARARSVVLQHR
ncbi:MFS transporter [Pseudonocardia xishanensis]|uniref:MFS transporter n=1 Tax=Pseudonocardia xishanensis TaxID=630995 RepID=A0ABP8RLS0_9PSEU